MDNLTIKFLKEYDSGDLKFNSLQYRKGASVTGKFGLSEGYRFIDNKMIFDICRIHSGIDRSFHGTNGVNTVISPFDFQRATFIDYGEDHVYGSMLRLFNDEYGFEMRIVHIYPSELTPEFKSLLDNESTIPRNIIIGKAGSYGSASSGRHTHTEFLSQQDGSCKIFDDLLEMKYREHAFIPYENDYVLDFYRTQDFWKEERRDSNILLSFKAEMKKRKIENGMLNGFSYYYFDWYNQALTTRYSSELLFNGL